ncbi:MAG: CCA tRNA nucleotidyltransferase [Kiritimatiellaeota bacterium]|nr:CCA tRNA nucleotidyltransferase [Kiritimatiellota bacterium]
MSLELQTSVAPFRETPAGRVAGALRRAGHETYFAGGCVRDTLLGREPKDIDVATAATPEEIEALFPKTVAVGKQFGVIVVVQDESPVEVATFRTDGDYTDGRRPNAIAFSSPKEDALRRDFTINGLFMEIETGRVIDFVGGEEDLRHGIVRAIGDPARRFAEDRLRMIRAVRFAGTLGFAVEHETAAAIRAAAPHIGEVSAERIGQEVVRILAESRAAGASVALLADLGLLPRILPEVDILRGVEQPPEFHPEGDVLTHTCLMLDAMPPPPRSQSLGLAVLLHDVGKKETFLWRTRKDGTRRITFRGHADCGAGQAEAILRRLKLPGDLVHDVTKMVKRHMHFIEVMKMNRATLRHFMASPIFPLELELTRLDQLHSTGDTSLHDYARNAYEAFQSEPILPPRWVTGKDLRALGIPPGPALGALLKEAYALQLDNAFLDKAALLAHCLKRSARLPT